MHESHGTFTVAGVPQNVLLFTRHEANAAHLQPALTLLFLYLFFQLLVFEIILRNHAGLRTQTSE